LLQKSIDGGLTPLGPIVKVAPKKPQSIPTVTLMMMRVLAGMSKVYLQGEKLKGF